MILLLGGTSETAKISASLADAGYKVLVSTATGAELDIGHHRSISRRVGRLTEEAMLSLACERGVSAIVDATHPYAAAVRATAASVADRAGIPYLTFIRPTVGRCDDDVLIAGNHEEAAALAFAIGRPVLLTTGSRNLEPYVQESRKTGASLIVRVLDHSESLDACHKADLKDEQVILGRGPFSVSENRAAIRKHDIGVLVTKDSGITGGVEEKLNAARLESCRVVMVQRPDLPSSNAFSCIEELVKAIVQRVTLAQEH